jgi:sulfoxide reductase heme-binding subunit YedZ
MLKALTFSLSLIPGGYLAWLIYLLQAGEGSQLGADPGKAVVIYLGEWTIRFLLLTLAVSPVRRLTAWNQLQRVRRMLGLFTFAYASLHLAAYCLFLLELDPSRLGADLVKRPYITVGFAAWLLLLPLAATSSNFAMRRLRHRWQWLHRWVYLVAVLAITHLIWLSKASYQEAALYGVLALLLLAARVLGPLKGLFRQALNRDG